MQAVYPAILTTEGSSFLIYLPDVGSGVRGESLFLAMQNARRSLSRMKELPAPSDLSTAICKAASIGNLVSPDVSMEEDVPITIRYIFIDVDTDITY